MVITSARTRGVRAVKRGLGERGSGGAGIRAKRKERVAAGPAQA